MEVHTSGTGTSCFGNPTNHWIFLYLQLVYQYDTPVFIDQGGTLARPQVAVEKKRFNGRFRTVIQYWKPVIPYYELRKSIAYSNTLAPWASPACYLCHLCPSHPSLCCQALPMMPMVHFCPTAHHWLKIFQDDTVFYDDTIVLLILQRWYMYRNWRDTDTFFVNKKCLFKKGF